MARRILALALLVMLVSCSGQATEPPAADPLPRIATTPALEPWVSRWVSAYHEAHGQLGFEVEVLAPAAALAAAERGSVALLVAGLEAPDGWFATPLGREAIAVVVHADNSIRSYESGELASLFSGRVRSWEALGGAEGTVQVVIPLTGDEMRERFEAAVMGGASSTSYALLAGSPDVMISVTGADPLAIGYIPFSQDPGETRIVRVEGRLPSETSLTDYPLLLEIIAMAPGEPIGALRDWLAWVQAEQTPVSP